MTCTTMPAALLAHELVGPADAPLVLVLGGISASRHVTRGHSAELPGWWEDIVGDGRTIDTRTMQVLGVDYLDGGRSATGRPARIVTTHDQADAIVSLFDALGVQRVHAVVGASYGGMVTLALAERWPDRLERAVVISAAHESYPFSTALRVIQRRVVELGLDTGRASDAMTLARALAMTTYRSAAEFGERFGAAPELHEAGATFDVERYLLHAGARYARATPAERFLALSLSADLHRVVPEAVAVRTSVIAAEGDALVPAAQTTELAHRLPRLAGHFTIPTRVGHDAFLAEPERLAPILTSALTS